MVGTLLGLNNGSVHLVTVSSGMTDHMTGDRDRTGVNTLTRILSNDHSAREGNMGTRVELCIHPMEMIGWKYSWEWGNSDMKKRRDLRHSKFGNRFANL